MTSLQAPGSQNNPDPFADLVARLGKMQSELNDLTSSVLKSGGIRVSPDGMTIESALAVDGSLDVSGDADFTGSTTVGGTMVVTGDATFEGDLAVPNGSITNDALQNPLRPVFNSNVAYGMAYMSAAEYVLSLPPIAVPAGYTRVIGLADGSAGIHPTVNNTFGVRCRIDMSDGSWWTGTRSDASVFAGGYTSSPAFLSMEGPVPAGGTVTVTVRVVVGLDVPADPYNWGAVSATLIFTR